MIKKIYFNDNGTTAVFDEQGKQIPELQKSWIQLYLQFLKEKGKTPTEIMYQLPDGKNVEVFETTNGYNWRHLR